MKPYQRMLKQAELKQIQKELAEVRAQRDANEKILEGVVEELKNEDLELETLKSLREQVEKLGEENDGLDGKIKELEEKESELESELTEEPEGKTEGGEKRGENMGIITRERTREMVRSGEYYERADVKEFYNSLKSMNTRAVGGESLTIPLVIVNRIYDILGDYTTLYPLVDVIKASGTTRILLDTDTGEATWTEQASAITEGTVGTITNVDFDGYKLGKIVYVDNYILQDSIINIDNYVTNKLARAIGKALDKAILLGTGSANYQPIGILTALAAETSTPHIKSVDKDASVLVNTVKQIASIDDGTDSTGEIVAVMKRETYYNVYFQYSVQVNSSGNVVGKLPNLTNPDLIGIRVVFNNYMPADTVLFGDFSKYTLVDREDMAIDRSEHYKFKEDQTSFRGKARYDGKVVDTGAFVRVNLVTPTP